VNYSQLKQGASRPHTLMGVTRNIDYVTLLVYPTTTTLILLRTQRYLFKLQTADYSLYIYIINKYFPGNKITPVISVNYINLGPEFYIKNRVKHYL